MPTPVDILLVDDEPRNLDVLEAILADPGYRLLRAENADQALKLLLNGGVAAIVLDIKMPGMSGVELAQTIKKTKRFRETPIVFLTAYLVGDEDVLAGYGAGAVDYLTKPVNPQILRRKVAVFADLYGKTRELAALNAQLATLNESLEERVRERTAELQRSESALRAADTQKDEFLAMLAHELRNPLAPLRTGLDLLRHHNKEPTPVVARTLAGMSRQLTHVVRLIDDLLDVSRISRGLLELKRERIDLVSVVRMSLEGAQAWFEQRGQVVTAELPESVDALADATRVAQMVTNLLHNAAKFTPKGGTIRVELSALGDTARLRVVDSGPGIAEEHLARIFEMFARIARPGAASEPGLGIGLAVTRRLAEMHGGSLTVSSDGEGKGASFTLDLPVLLPSERVVSAAPADAPPTAGGPLDIVVVEDNDDIADGLADWLAAHGHRVSVARTGKSGLALIRDSRPRVVLCDIGLPEMDGLDVCRQVRALPEGSQPLMVALTGWGRAEDISRSREAGFDHHLVKPVALEKLEAVLESAAGVTRQERPPEPRS